MLISWTQHVFKFNVILFPPCSSDNYPDRLQCLRQPIIDDRICRNAYPHLFTDNMVCSGFMHGGASSCQVSWTEPLWIHRESGGAWVCILSQQYTDCLTQWYPANIKYTCFLNALWTWFSALHLTWLKFSLYRLEKEVW